MKSKTTVTCLISFLLVTCAVLTPAKLFAEKFKVGDVSKEELKMQSYKKDPDARALMIRDDGKRIMGLGDHFIERHFRIKIFTKEGYDLADYQIDLYRGAERLVRLKAYTFNLENGKVKKTKIKKRDVIYEEVSEHHKIAKISLPNVKEGSVIDVYYLVSSSFYGLGIPDWYFQYDFPVMESNLELKVPERFNFKHFIKGYENIQSFPVTTRGKTMAGTNNTYVMETHHFKGTHIPAFKEEPFMTTRENYISKIEFDLVSIRIPGYRVKDFSRTWEDVCESLLELNRFGGQLRGGGYLRDIEKAIKNATDNKIQQMKMARQKIAENIAWNGSNRLLVTNYKREAFNNQKGSSADINFNLIQLLRRLGLHTEPLALSTRSNGIIRRISPSFRDFNYVVAAVLLDGKYYLLDATDPYLPAEMLPKKCLNGSGLLVSEKQQKWIKIRSKEVKDEVTNMLIAFDKESGFTGQVKIELTGYPAASARKDISQKGEDKFLEELKENYDNWEISGFKASDYSMPGMEFSYSFTVSIKDKTNQTFDMFFFNPLLGNGIQENPFKIENRKFPVDFTCPFSEDYRITITLPPGYKVDESPQPANVALPQQAGSFQYLINAMGNSITIVSKFEMNKVFFQNMEYPMIKQLYQIISDKHQEPIVLKTSNIQSQ
ncbi:MAG: DUF3857 domain-containing protein [Bacteroidales bacterium]|nr:DUF3857 domain-containing protein [Bacteroidales bacterium]